MKKLLLLSICSFVFLTNSFGQLSQALQARLQFVLDSVCDHYNIKGASAAVLMPQAGTWTGAWGESHTGNPITTGMFFGIGSNTKTYISTLMLKLQEDGMLDLDDTIGAWIQNVPNVNGQITIRQMLNHTSGLYSFTNHPNYFPTINGNVYALHQPEDVLQFINAPLFAPGTDWDYSNTNYLLAGLIIKAVLGTDCHQALRDSILQPAGLSNTVFYPFEAPPGPIPHAWSINFGSPYLVDGISVGWDHTANFSMAGAAGAIMATAEDNVKFWDKLMSGNIINSASLQEMKTVYPLQTALGYGLGIFKRSYFNGHTAYSHGGTNVCFINENIYDDVTGTCISVLTNQDSVSNNTLLLRVVSALHKETLGPLSVAPAAQQRDISVYPNPARNYVNINSNEDGLSLHLTDVSGKEVLQQEIKKGTTEISLENISTGLYFIRLANSKDEIVFADKLSIN